MEKNFDEWNVIKKHINNQDKLLDYEEREVWWCSLGINVGSEQDGKNGLYERPVVVFKKFNWSTFWAVPLTSKATENNDVYNIFNIPIQYNDKSGVAIISQLRLISAKRLQRKIGFISEESYSILLLKFKDIVDNITKSPLVSGDFSEAEARSGEIIE